MRRFDPNSRARLGVSLLFWLNGMTIASIIPRYPLIRDSLGLTNTLFGFMVAAGPVGALLAGFVSGRLLRRFGSARMAVWAQMLQIVMFVVAISAPTAPLFAVGFFLLYASDVYTDIAMNAHGLRVQQGYGRSINNAFHAMWSIGAVCGGALGALFAHLETPLFVHGLAVGSVMMLINVSLRGLLLTGPDPTAVSADASPAPPLRAWSLVLPLGLLAACSVMLEDVGFSWSSLYLHDALGAPSALAAAGFVCPMAAHTIGRLTGDRLVDRLGHRGTARLGALVAASGMSFALAVPSIPSTFVGLACAGWGVATLVPSVYVAGHHLPGLAHGNGLVAVNWILRMALFVGPILVGALADSVGFGAAMLVMPIAALAVLALSRSLTVRPSQCL